MHRIFKKVPYRGAMISSKFIQAKFKLEESLNRAIEYYQGNSTYLNNNHLLIRLVTSLTFDVGTPLDIVYRSISSNSDKIAHSLGITTDVNSGKIFTKELYTSNCAFISTTYSNPLSIPHWKHIRAVRVMTHPHTTLNLVLPNRLHSLDDSDYSVVGIDIPLLAVQYQQWVLTQEAKTILERDTVAQFVLKWVLPGMLKEQIDISLRNRFTNIALGTTRDEVELKEPIFMQGYDAEFDKAYKDIIKYIRTGSRRAPSEVMIGLPMFNSDNYWEAVPRNLQSLSMMSYWIQLLVYTDWLYPMSAAFDNVDPNQDLVTKRLMVTQRYVDGTNADKFIRGHIEELWRSRYDTLLKNWGE